MTDKMFKLSDKYANLLIEVRETKIKVVDDSRNYPRVTMFYGDLLEPGTMVYFKSRQRFYGVGVLHGVWTNSDGEAKSVYDFLTDIIDFGRPVEVVFDPRHFTLKGMI